MKTIFILILIIIVACVCCVCYMVSDRAIYHGGRRKKHEVASLVAEILDIPFDDAKYTKLINQSPAYAVGESSHNGGVAVDERTAPCYDLNYIFAIHKTDVVVQKVLRDKHIPYEKIFTSALSAFLPLRNTKNTHTNKVVFDVGANIGTVSIPLSRAAQVYSFEPFEMTHAFLKHNIKINKSSAIPLRIALGDKTRKSITLSSEVSASPEEIASSHSTHNYKKPIPNIDDLSTECHFAAVQIGLGDEHVPMYTIDDFNMHVDLIKVDVEGAEPLVFWGARDTITRCMPVIAFERNDAVVSDEMCAVLNCSNEAAAFDVVDFCRDLGYDTLMEVPFNNYIVFHSKRHLIRPGAIFKTRPIGCVSQKEKFNAHGYKLLSYMAPWLNINFS